MFDKIQHIGYLVSDLDAAVRWYEKSFGATNAAGSNIPPGGVIPSGGRNAFVRFGQVEAELIEPNDKAGLPPNKLVMHHVGYVVSDIARSMEQLKARGFRFMAEAPFTNVLGQQVLYFDAATANGVFIHLTQPPAQPDNKGFGQGVPVERIVHAGYLVADVEEAVAWYTEKLDGEAVGGIGASRAGSRNAYVNFGQVQVELIEAADASALNGQRYVMDHAGLVVADINAGIAQCRNNGLKFVADAPNTNRIGQQLLYLDTDSALGTRMHLTQLPD